MHWYLFPQSAAYTILAMFVGLAMTAAFVGYDYYKTLAWPVTSAVINSIEEECVYAKRRVFRIVGPKYHRRYLDCDAKEEAGRLIADGYRKKATSKDVWVIYEPEAGRKLRAVIDDWPASVDYPRVGRSIRVRYSPGRPDRVEYATELGHKGKILGIIIIGVLGLGCALFVHLLEFEDP